MKEILFIIKLVKIFGLLKYCLDISDRNINDINQLKIKYYESLQRNEPK